MPGYKTSAWPLGQAYMALIVYASLYPFAGWRIQGIAPWEFLFSGWPRYWTGFDVAANIAGYAPLGFLLALAHLRRAHGDGGRPWAKAAALAVAAAVSLALSFCMEALQTFLPARVPSNVDFGLNVLGALLGALLAVALEWTGASIVREIAMSPFDAFWFQTKFIIDCSSIIDTIQSIRSLGGTLTLRTIIEMLDDANA